MAEIVEVFDDIKKHIGDKGFYLLVGAAAIFGIYNLAKGSSGDSADMASTRVVTSVSSYPDAVTNANVIIDTIQNSIDYSQNQIQDSIQGTEDELKDVLDKNFEATNDYINKGFESQKEILDTNFDEINGSLSDIKDSQVDIKESISDMQSSMNSGFSSLKGSISSVGNKVDTVNKNVTAAKKKTPAKKKTTAKKTTKKADTYKYKTKAGYNTSTSIMDAMKVTTGNYDTKATSATIKKVAAANGIKNYSGTYNQNVTLLSKLKKGTLKKA